MELILISFFLLHREERGLKKYCQPSLETHLLIRVSLLIASRRLSHYCRAIAERRWLGQNRWDFLSVSVRLQSVWFEKLWFEGGLLLIVGIFHGGWSFVNLILVTNGDKYKYPSMEANFLPSFFWNGRRMFPISEQDSWSCFWRSSSSAPGMGWPPAFMSISK